MVGHGHGPRGWSPRWTVIQTHGKTPASSQERDRSRGLGSWINQEKTTRTWARRRRSRSTTWPTVGPDLQEAPCVVEGRALFSVGSGLEGRETEAGQCHERILGTSLNSAVLWEPGLSLHARFLVQSKMASVFTEPSTRRRAGGLGFESQPC